MSGGPGSGSRARRPRGIAACLVLACVAWLAAMPSPVQDAVDALDAVDEVAASVFVEVEVPTEEVYVGQAVRAVVRVGIERAFLGDALISPFRRRVDVPVELRIPWGVPSPASAATSTRTVVVDGEVVEARLGAGRVLEGRAFEVLELPRTVTPEEPGTLVLDGVTARAVFATRFEDDFLAGRVPVDRHERTWSAPARGVEVRRLPEAGRPASFTGAVGAVSITADVAPRDGAVGDRFRWTITIATDAPRDAFTSPSLPAPRGTHALGTVVANEPDACLVHHDFVALEPHVVLPAVEFAWFDPAPPGAYRVARTEPIVLELAPGEAGADLAPSPGPGDAITRAVGPSTDGERSGGDAPRATAAGDAHETRASDGDDDPDDGARGAVPVGDGDDGEEPDDRVDADDRRVPLETILGTSIALVIALVILVRGFGASDASDASGAGASRDDGASAYGVAPRADATIDGARLRARLEAGESAEAVLVACVAGRLGIPRAGVITPSLRARLVDAGVDVAVATDAARLLEDLVGARYGGPDVPDATARARALLDPLTQS